MSYQHPWAIERLDLQRNANKLMRASRQAREDYIQGLRDKRSDDELRSLHHNANEAYAASDKAFRALIGERKYNYQV